MNKTASIRSDNYLLTVEEAARELRISKWTIYQLIRSEELKTLTIASRRLVASDDLKDFIDKRRCQAPLFPNTILERFRGLRRRLA